MTDCPRFGKWFGCRFEARYDLGPPDLTAYKTVSAMSRGALEMHRRQTYVCDICVRCGATIERNPLTPEPAVCQTHK
jgi:hypothetical protein